MKDMFYKYDNEVKDLQPENINENERKILSNDNNLEIVFDAKGNEIGVRARKDSPFSLYFNLFGEVNGSTIDDLVLNSNIVFQINDYWHKNIITKELTAANCYENETIKISLSQEDVNKLNIESYTMNLTLNYPGGLYILFRDTDGLLIVR